MLKVRYNDDEEKEKEEEGRERDYTIYAFLTTRKRT